MPGKNDKCQTMKCSQCGGAVEVVKKPSGFSVNCCGEPMKATGSSRQSKGRSK